MQQQLKFLLSDIKYLKGVGPGLAIVLAKLNINNIFDLLLHFPVRYNVWKFVDGVEQIDPQHTCCLRVRVVTHQKPPRGTKRPYRVICSDARGKIITLIYFAGNEKMLQNMLPEGQEKIVCGLVEYFDFSAQFPHPEYVGGVELAIAGNHVKPVYPLTANLNSAKISSLVKQAMHNLQEFDEWISPQYKALQEWPDMMAALKIVHFPEGNDLEFRVERARNRLRYDEVMAHQIALISMRNKKNKMPLEKIQHQFALMKKAAGLLPYKLTGAQQQAIDEIMADMQSGFSMSRLLQGDVGSGKTIVAFLASLMVIESGKQAAIMVPTSILCAQHFASLKPLCDALGVSIVAVAGSDKAKDKQKKLAAIESGEVNLVIGTHALFYDAIKFKILGLVVVDEQHRFGVRQRMRLAEKGNTHILLMTATPIPRSLCMAIYGDMDLSAIREKPAGRKEIITKSASMARLDEIAESIGRAVNSGSQVYWICPLVAESEELDLSAVEKRFDYLKSRFGEMVGIVHGQMASSVREQEMQRFVDGISRILVATTVIEVGVNVPNATIIIIEHAERFGLAQLHQLRGRVGRGDKQSTCMLLYGEKFGHNARERIKTMRDTNDGFVIAEADLKLRGGGEVTGTRQSGVSGFKLSSPSEHPDIYIAANAAAKSINPVDTLPAIKVLLKLFELDDESLLLKA